VAGLGTAMAPSIFIGRRDERPAMTGGWGSPWLRRRNRRYAVTAVTGVVAALVEPVWLVASVA